MSGDRQGDDNDVKPRQISSVPLIFRYRHSMREGVWSPILLGMPITQHCAWQTGVAQIVFVEWMCPVLIFFLFLGKLYLERTNVAFPPQSHKPWWQNGQCVGNQNVQLMSHAPLLLDFGQDNSWSACGTCSQNEQCCGGLAHITGKSRDACSLCLKQWISRFSSFSPASCPPTHTLIHLTNTY